MVIMVIMANMLMIMVIMAILALKGHHIHHERSIFQSGKKFLPYKILTEACVKHNGHDFVVHYFLLEYTKFFKAFFFQCKFFNGIIFFSLHTKSHGSLDTLPIPHKF